MRSVRRASIRRSLGVALAATIALPASVAAVGPEGVPDTSFSGDGVVFHDPKPASSDWGSDLALQADGRIVVAGESGGTGNFIMVARFTSSGAPDTTFNSTGTLITQALGKNSVAYAVAVQDDGKIVVGGQMETADGADAFAMRLTSSGALDTTFSGDGIATASVSPHDTVNDMVVQPDGKIVLVGYTRVDDAPTSDDVLVVRFTASGALDTSFSGDGKLTIDVDQFDEASAVALTPDGKLMLAGSAFGSGGTDLLAMRITAAGVPDSSFNGTGVLRLTGADETYPSELAVLEDGRAVLAGFLRTPADDQYASLVMVTASGAFDESFGSDGVRALDDLPESAGLAAVAVQPDGRIVATGSFGSAWGVLRTTGAGALDPTFSGDGFTTIAMDAIHRSPAAIRLDPRGRVLTTGSRQPASGDNDVVLTRLLGDGTAPYGARMVGLPKTTTLRTRTLSWTASDDNTGVATWDVRVRSASATSATYGSTSTWKSATSLPYGSYSASSARTYCFGVRARDVAGNTGAWGPWSCMAVPVNDRSLTRAGSWSSSSNSGYYMGTAARSSSSGATLKYSGADYKRLSIIATTCSSCGTVKVYRGSTLLKTISLKSSSTKRRVIIPVQVSATTLSGTITLKQASSGKPVIIEGLAIGLD